jgi:KaiC/GvpD/RAD55 family RecA-like ATPase
MVKQKTKDISENVLRPGSQVLIEVSGEKYIKSFSEIIERLTKKQGRRGILISTQWSANALTRRVSISKLPKNSLKVIDTISLSIGSKLTPSEDFVYLSTPVSLEAILMEIERTIRAGRGDHNFLILDSLTHLKRYYTDGQLSEFFHFLLNRMLEEEFSVLLFEQEEIEGSRISKELSSIIDHTLTISKGGGVK